MRETPVTRGRPQIQQHTICDNRRSTIHLLELIDRPNVGANPDLGNLYWSCETPEETCEEAILARMTTPAATGGSRA